jgi:CheY-like chemotaxis protein
MRAPDGPVTQLDDLPQWISRVVLADANSAGNAVLANQLSMLGIDMLRPQGDIASADLRPGDVLLIDSRQPGGSGLGMLRDLRGQGCTTPAVLINAETMPELSRTDEPAAVLTRPLSRRALIATLGTLRVNTAVVGSGVVPVAPQRIAETPRKMRILAAEDNKTNRLVFSKLVAPLNVELEFAVNGQEAFEKWQAFQPDLIFMDISMPEVDGKQATSMIRAAEAQSGRPHTTIVALTAHAMEGDDSAILAAGLDHYLTKPLKKAEIFERIFAERPESAEPLETASLAAEA